MTQAEQNAAAEEARKKFAAEDAAVAAAKEAAKEAAAKRPSRGNVVAYDKWKENPQDHPEYEKLAADAAAANEERQRLRNARLGPVIGPSRESIKRGIADARAREIAKLTTTPQPPTTGSPTPGRPSRKLNPLGGSRGGNKQRTRKRQRIASTHHHTKRRILRNKNHKHTRKARLTRASGSV